MAQPITWQNVTAPSNLEAARFMGMAQNGIDAGFDKLGSVLKQRETTDAANYAQGGVNNAEAFKSALYGMTTPEQMAAAQKSGQFNDMLTGYGANVKDPGALRALMDGRLAALQGQSTANMTYGNAVQDQKNDPLLQEYRLASPARQAEIVAQNPGMRGLGAVVQDTQKFGWEGDKAAAAKLLAPATLAATQAQTNQANAQAANIPQELAIKAQNANLQTLDRLAEMRIKAQDSLRKNGSGLMSGVDADKELTALITSADPNKERAAATNRQISTALLSNPEFKKLSLSQVAQVARKYSKNTNDYTFSNFIPEMTKELNALVTSGGVSEAASVAAKADAAAGLSQINAQIEQAQAKAFPELAAAKATNDARVSALKAALPIVGGVAPPSGTAQPAPVGAVTAATAQTAATDALFQQQVVAEVQAKDRDSSFKYSPEVAAYIDAKPQRDREELRNVGRAIGGGAESAWAAAQDIFSYVPRAFLPQTQEDAFRGGTPYTEALNARRSGPLAAADAKAQVELIRQQLSEARNPTKKAR